MRTKQSAPRVAVIVGMGPGVSLAVARRFGREGHTLACLARNPQRLRVEVEQLRSAGFSAHAYVTDAADSASLATALTTVARDLGPPRVLIYNAVAARHKPLAELLPDELEADLRVNVVGALAAAQAVVPAMKVAGQGTLLFTGGGFALEPVPTLATLGVGKAALRNLVFSLHAELWPMDIRAATVTICGEVHPGTPFDPERIAEAFWTLDACPADHFEREMLFRG